MSETSETSTVSSKVRDHHHRNRIRRKFNRTRLPTPPPDPTLFTETPDPPESPIAADKDEHFFEYINSFSKIQHVPLSPVGVAEDAFDHLEKLYRLMEQMLNLRQQNAKLQRRIQDLEHLKNLESVQRLTNNTSVPVFEDISEVDDDSIFAENLLDTMLVGSKKDLKSKPWNRSRLRQSLMKKQRNRGTLSSEKSLDFNNVDDRRCSGSCDRDKSSKVSKWTKVKAAFRWEKASPSVSGAKSQDSGIGGMLPVNYEIARYLRVPSTTEDAGTSPADSGAADGSTPGTLSSASSADDLHRQDHRGELQVSDDDRHSISLDEENLSRQGSNSNNSSRASWFKAKNVTSSTINSQEKYRLSIVSDDSKIDTSDNEDLFDHNESLNTNNQKRKREDIPEVVIERYKKVLAEDESVNKHNVLEKASKWDRVKKAFLTPSLHNTTSNSHKNRSSVLTEYKDNRHIKHNDESKKIQDEIQKNYKLLQKKLSIEFQGKLQEWDKMKSQGAINISKNDGSEDQKDHAFIKKMEEWQRIKSQPSRPGQNIQMIREENLAPEFKKKLEEWQKIKKYAVKDDNPSTSKTKKKIGEWPKWKSISGPREDHTLIETPPLSDEFLKKLEKWKRIKELSKHNGVKEKTPSPRISRKQTSEISGFAQKPIKDSNEKELHWFEKELNKIELEKQRLEDERDKFLQREEKLAKLRRTVMGDGNKKDVLIHTSSGFYRFEGISRKFTQKLCQWEKARGIGPEASTFALLSSKFQPQITVDFYESNNHQDQSLPQYNPSRIIRSKSAESISTKNLIQNCPSHHPSSLSLNDVDELEKQMSLSRASSVQDIDISLEKFRNDEPEAVIVEVEDVEEETADLLEERLEEKHFAVYQREMALSVCEKQPCIIPYIQSIYSHNLQPIIPLIDKAIKLVRSIEEDEGPRNSMELEIEGNQADSEQSPSPDMLKGKDKRKLQCHRGEAILELLIRIQEMHSKSAYKAYLHENSHMSNATCATDDLFLDLFQMVEQLQNILCKGQEENCAKPYFQFNDFAYSNTTATTSELTSKLCELKKVLLSYYSDPDKATFSRRITEYRSQENKVQQNSEDNVSLRRLRYKKRDFCNKTVCESEDSDVYDGRENFCKTNSKDELDPTIIEKLIIPTKPNFLVIPDKTLAMEQTPIEILVKTTRKIFTPIVNTDIPSLTDKQYSSIVENEKIDKPIVHLPPPKASPAPQRKASKEISPGIRLMLTKYNQLISKQENAAVNKSAGNSGSASPVAWRSPVSERRVRAQRERYMEEIQRIGNQEVKKSASVNFLHLEKQMELSLLADAKDTVPSNKGILRSTSASVIQTCNSKQENSRHPSLKIIIPEQSDNRTVYSVGSRISKINKAKEDFLNSPSTPNPEPCSAPPIFPTNSDNVMKYPTKSRYSQISMGSESSCDSAAYGGILVKSASAGMINIDEDTYKQIDPAFHQEGYVSLPRSVTKQKEGLLKGKLSLSNIAAKFRKVKMRKNRDQKKMNTVSALCRQSLVVNINPEVQVQDNNTEKQSRRDSLTVPVDKGASSSDDTSPCSSRSGSWIRRSKIFKVL